MSTPYEVLDLHGYTREKALAKLAFFLDQLRHKYLRSESSSASDYPIPSSMPVEIITGSGKHSPNGPVLRQAVEKVLMKRQMTFQLNHGKGSFTVDAFSGDSFEPSQAICPTDTKVIVEQNPGVPNKDVKLVNRPNNNAQEVSSYSVSPVSTFQGMPTPGETMKEEKQLEDAKRLSKRESSKQASVRTKEANQLEQAIMESMNTCKEQEEEESKALREALELSRKEEEDNQCRFLNTINDEKAMIAMALKLSKEQK